MEYPKQDENVNEQIYNSNEDTNENIAMTYPEQDENVNEQIYNGNEDIDANIAMTYQEQDENVNDQYVIRFQSSNERTQSFTKLRELLDSVRLNKLKE